MRPTISMKRLIYSVVWIYLRKIWVLSKNTEQNLATSLRYVLGSWWSFLTKCIQIKAWKKIYVSCSCFVVKARGICYLTSITLQNITSVVATAVTLWMGTSVTTATWNHRSYGFLCIKFKHDIRKVKKDRPVTGSGFVFKTGRSYSSIRINLKCHCRKGHSRNIVDVT